jgi:Toastrack DUF4097
MKKILSLIFYGLTLFILFSSCSNDNGLNFNTDIKNTDHAAFENFNYYVGINEQTRLVLDGINGTIKISPTNAIAVTIAGERKVQSESDADAENFLDYVKVRFEDNSDEVYVYTEQPSNTGGRIVTVTYNIKIPAGWSTVISNTNGGLQIDSLSGTVKADIVNGSIVLNAINANVDLALVNGTIDAAISVPDAGSCKMDLTNGVIDLIIPKTTNASLNANVVNGSVVVTNLSVQNIISTSSSFKGTLGTGSALITLGAVNGEINVAGY